MRYQLMKLSRRTSTPSERRVGELLKRNRIKFQTKVRIGTYEVDFVIGKLVLEIDGENHKSSVERDSYLFSQGYTPVHITNSFKPEIILYLIKTNNYVC